MTRTRRYRSSPRLSPTSDWHYPEKKTTAYIATIPGIGTLRIICQATVPAGYFYLFTNLPDVAAVKAIAYHLADFVIEISLKIAAVAENFPNAIYS